jgi:hypothetical protein
VPVQAGHVEALSAVPGAATVLESLRERELVQIHSPTYTVADNVGAALQAEADRVARSTAVVDHLTRWIQRQEAAAPLEDRELVLAAIGWAGEAGRWREALLLCRGIEGALMTARRWGEWQLVLEQAAVAARQLGDQLAVGWALHQLGTLALCREDYGAAQSLLGQALAVRQRAGDAEGALVTRHNLKVLAQLTAPPGPGSPPSLAARIFGWKLLLLLIALIAASAGVAIATSGGRRGIPPTVVSPAPPSVTVSSSSNNQSPTPNRSSSPQTSGTDRGGSPPAPRVVLDLKQLNLGDHFPGELPTVKTVTVTNKGAADATISDVRATGEFSRNSHCPAPNARLGAGQSCTVDVQFGPTTPGQKSGLLMITDTTGGHTAELIGFSRLPLQLNPNPVDFGKVPVGSNTLWIDATLTNLTGVSQSYGASTSPSGPFFGLTSRCFESGTLPPHGSCVIPFAFSPQQPGQVQVVGATVRDAYGDEYQLQLTGVGTPTVPTLPTVTPPPPVTSAPIP